MAVESNAANPRRHRGEGSVYRRASDGRWVGILDLGWRDGKRRRKTVYGRTQREAVRKLGEAKRGLAEHGDLPTATLTVQAWLAIWLRDIAPTTGKPTKMRGYREKCRNYIVPAIGKVRLDKLTAQHVRDLHRFVMVTKGLAPATAYQVHRVLHVALNDAMRDGKVARNVVTLVKAPVPEKDKGEALSLPDARAVGHVIDGTRSESRWLMALLLGARQGECLGARWDLLDLEAGAVDLSWQLQRIPYKHGCIRSDTPSCGRRTADRCPARELDVRPGFEHKHLDGNQCLIRPKTVDSVRLVPIPPPLLTSLRRRNADYLEERAAYTVDHGLVWARLDGRPQSERVDREEWSAILEAAGIPHKPLHSARHTTATLLQAIGVPESTRMMILGHSSVTTQRRYAHRDLTLQRQALEALGERLALTAD